MFSKVLIANRGEIAVRIIRTLRDMGIRSVALYTDADRTSLHVRMADEAYALSPLQDSEGYLAIARIIDIAKHADVQAIHPGYGFLSENAEFAAACVDADITFIGPLPEHIEMMGSKTAAREVMKRTGLPLVPGSPAGSDDELMAAATQLTFPLLIKAAAGGGGRGMRLVHTLDELKTALSSARREALKAFGSDVVYLERAVLRPRHVEIQVFGDHQGNAIHLYERDCSIQRRHQKVIEEAPAPLADKAQGLLPEMADAARLATQHLGYVGAGTMEFLVSEEDNAFYFLEMNTRIQVEHPITELTTGLDLVEEQIRVAAGQSLQYQQNDIQRFGHAIECRVYAESPERGFLPSPGKIEILREPSGANIRNDTGYYQGAEVPTAYDALISKLCAWGPTRQTAINRMHRALHEYAVTGIDTNLVFLSNVMIHKAFQSGSYATDFIERYPETLLPPDTDKHAQKALAVVAGHAHQRKSILTSPPAPQTTSISAWRRAICEPS